jgi:hypothetical protein
MDSEETSFEKVRRKMVAARVEFMGQLAKFSPDELTQPRLDGNDWMPLQIANHLYIADGLALEHLKRVQEEDNPLIPDLAEETPRLTREAEPPSSLDSVLAGMAARREEVFEYLAQLPEEAWVRPLRHPEWGQLKFYQLVNVLPQHDKLHAGQLADIKAAAQEP